MARWKRAGLACRCDFALIFAVIALTILMASVLIGLNFSNWLVGADQAADERGQHGFDRQSPTSRCPCTNRKAISLNSAKPSTR